MSFPGYLKSVKLMHQRSEEIEVVSTSPKVSTAGTSGGDPKKDADEGFKFIGRSNTHLASGDNMILDEKENGPSKSLWVGNIPTKTTSTEIRTLFGKFGTIVSTKPATKYAFVNFETTESAIAAFKHYHDRDVFGTGNSTVNIRFTQTLEEAKQSKDTVRDRRSTAINRAEVMPNQNIPSASSVKMAPISSECTSTDWPNGKPPSGPKSHRREISPPVLRRGDSYRPFEVLRDDSYRPSEYARSERPSRDRGRSYTRRPSQHYSPKYERSESRSTSRTDTSLVSTRRNDIEGGASPFPWERQRLSMRSDDLVWTQQGADPHSDGITASNLHSDMRLSTHDQNFEEIDSIMVDPPSSSLSVLEGEATTVSARTIGHSNSTQNLSVKTGDDHLSNSNTQQSHSSKSPSLRPMERLRVETFRSVGSPVPSEVATTSSQASSKRRRCYDCKRAANDLSPLISCSKCTRRFHSGCGDPKPSSCSDKSHFVCGRCRYSVEAAQGSMASAATEKKLPDLLNEKVQLASPPLSLDREGKHSTNLSPRDDLMHILEDRTSLETFFPKRDAADEAPISSECSHTQLEPYGSATLPVSKTMQPGGLQPTDRCSSAEPISHATEEALENMNKYKAVTCKWWAFGSCTQSEEDCYYSHRHTNISYPDRKRTNKAWTCYDWLHDGCTYNEYTCLHAHRDTGLHVWQDGRPCFKHVTCFWWCRGTCKWDDEFCKFAHHDTGLYSLDPSEIWQGGSKFTLIRPSESSSRPMPRRKGTGLSTTSSTFYSAIETPISTHTTTDQSPDVSQISQSVIAGAKPLLTIDTSNNTSSVTRLPSTINNRPWPTTIGAPPQTPIEDSPDKLGYRSVSSLGTSFKFRPCTVDLPTPETEESTALEPELRDYLNAVGNKVPTTLWRDGRAEQQNDENTGTTCSRDAPPGFPKPASSCSNEEEKIGFSEPKATEQAPCSQDPRLRRKAICLNEMVEQSHSDDVSQEPCPAQHKHQNDRVASSAIANQDSNGENPRKGVRKCQNCQRTVFGTDLCRGCSNDKEGTFAETDSAQSHRLHVNIQAIDKGIEMAGSPSDAVSETVIVTSPTRSPSQTVSLQSRPANPLKRNALGSNMFLKNKRPKSSMLSSSSGSIRPAAYAREINRKRPSISANVTESRREPKQTLSDLISQERAKNKSQSTPIPDTRSVDVLAAADVHVPQNIDSPDQESLAQNFTPRDSQGNNKIDLTAPITRAPISASAHQLGSLHLHAPSLELSKAPVVTQGILDCNSKVKSLHEPHIPLKRSFKASHWRQSESPEPPPKVHAPNSLRQISQPSKFSPSAILRSPARSPPVEQRRPIMRRSISSRDTAANPKKFSWASSITCTQCQKVHKKCLHDIDGSYSATKCREYVLIRRNKPDTGRSKAEWKLIQQAAEIDPDTDEDLTEDESAISMDDLSSNGSEDDFVTANVDDNNDVVLDTSWYQDDSLIERIQGPPKKLQQQPPIKKSVSDQPARLESHAKAKSSQGIMFESESEDEDYFSDQDDFVAQKEIPVDPLYVRPRFSQNLFEIAPNLINSSTAQGNTQLHAFTTRPSRKEQWANLLSRQLQERREKFGNPHWEVNRLHADVPVIAFVERIVPPQNHEDRYAVGSVQTREEKITFRDFLGVPRIPEICLMNDGERLSFRDGQTERDRAFGRTGRGLGRRTTDDEKWPLRAT